MDQQDLKQIEAKQRIFSPLAQRKQSELSVLKERMKAVINGFRQREQKYIKIIKDLQAQLK